MVKAKAPPDLKPVVASNLTLLKDYRKMSQGQIAARAGISQSSVGRILSGSVAADLDTLSGLAHALGVEAWQLLVQNMRPDNLPILRGIDPREEALYERMKAAAAELAELQRKGER